MFDSLRHYNKSVFLNHVWSEFNFFYLFFPKYNRSRFPHSRWHSSIINTASFLGSISGCHFANLSSLTFFAFTNSSFLAGFFFLRFFPTPDHLFKGRYKTFDETQKLHHIAIPNRLWQFHLLEINSETIAHWALPPNLFPNSGKILDTNKIGLLYCFL